MNYYDLLLQDREDHTRKIRQLKERIAQLPPGSLQISRNGKYNIFRHCLEKERITIPTSDTRLIELMMLKAVYVRRLHDEELLLRSCNAYLRAYNSGSLQEKDYLLRHPEALRILKAQSHWTDPIIRAWAMAEYKSNPLHPEEKKYPTSGGILVRSEAEVIIAELLDRAGLAFRYEPEIRINGRVFYPDFEILHPTEYESFFWEHLGMMSNKEYREKNLRKLAIYTSAGIIPGLNLITTFGNDRIYVDAAKIQKTIDLFFF